MYEVFKLSHSFLIASQISFCRLEQIAVLSEDTVTPYYLWTTCFSQDTLTREAEEAGFQVCGIFGDAAGAPYDADSPTLAILLEK